MQTQISTNYISSSSLLSAGLLFESNPPTGRPIDPPDNTGGGTTTPAQPEEDESSES